MQKTINHSAVARGAMAVVLMLSLLAGTSTAVSADNGSDNSTNAPSDNQSFDYALTDDSVEASVARLYYASFDREGEQSGLAFWNNEVHNGRRLLDVANFFATSTEFTNKYGDLAPRDFVKQIYLNVLQRAGETEGVDYWTGQLVSGLRSRGGIVLAISDSAEFKQRLLNEFDDSSVNRLYCAYFLRWAEPEGRAFWREQYANGTSLASISQFFAGSPEFNSRYGSLSNTSFVERIYINVQDRQGETQGKTHWINELNTERMNRGQVMLAFSGSAEYKARFTAQEKCPTNTYDPNPPVENTNSALLQAIAGLSINFTGLSDVNPTLLDLTQSVDSEITGDISGVIAVSAGSDANGTNGTSANGATVTVTADGSVNYVPAAGFSGTDTFNVKYCDLIDGTSTPSTSHCVTTTIEVEVEDSNSDLLESIGNLDLDAGDFVYETLEDTDVDGMISTELSLDVSDDVIIVDAGADAGATNGFTANGGTAVVNSATGVVTITPADDYIGVDSVNVLVCDRLDATGEANLDSCVTTTLDLTVGHTDVTTLDCLPQLGNLEVLGGTSVVDLSLSQGGCLTPFLDLVGAGNLDLNLLDLDVRVNGIEVDASVDVDPNDPTLLKISILDELTDSDELTITAGVRLLGEKNAVANGLGLDLIDILLRLLGGNPLATDALLSETTLDVTAVVGSNGSLSVTEDNSGLIETLVDPILELLL